MHNPDKKSIEINILAQINNNNNNNIIIIKMIMIILTIQRAAFVGGSLVGIERRISIRAWRRFLLINRLCRLHCIALYCTVLYYFVLPALLILGLIATGTV